MLDGRETNNLNNWIRNVLFIGLYLYGLNFNSAVITSNVICIATISNDTRYLPRSQQSINCFLACAHFYRRKAVEQLVNVRKFNANIETILPMTVKKIKLISYKR